MNSCILVIYSDYACKRDTQNDLRQVPYDSPILNGIVNVIVIVVVIHSGDIDEEEVLQVQQTEDALHPFVLSRVFPGLECESHDQGGYKCGSQISSNKEVVSILSYSIHENAVVRIENYECDQSVLKEWVE